MNVKKINKLCPVRRVCLDKGSCGNCSFSKAFDGYDRKLKKLKAENEKLKAENEKLKQELDDLSIPGF